MQENAHITPPQPDVTSNGGAPPVHRDTILQGQNPPHPKSSGDQAGRDGRELAGS